LNNKILDPYLFSKVEKGFSWLSSFYSTLGSFFKYLNKNYNFPNLLENSEFRLKDYKPNTPRRKYLDRHQLLKFLQTLILESKDLDRDLLLFLLLFSTGSRISELLGAVVSEIDINNELIYRKKTKNGSSKYIILREGFGDVLQTYIESNELKSDDYLFNINKKRLTQNYVQSLFSSYLEKANLPLVTLHSTRHSFATFMAEEGASIRLIQLLLNHKRINSTSIYIHLVPNRGIKLKENQKIYDYLKY
jgi:site-specific recombinase XerD